MFVMLRGDWQGSLKRSIKTADGKLIREYEFHPKAPTELVEDNDLVALARDCVGDRPKLLPVEFDDQHRGVVLPQKVILDTIDSLTKKVPTAPKFSEKK